MQMSPKAARVNARIPLWRAAELLLVTPQTLSKYESGVTVPPVDVVSRMLELYGLKFEEILWPTMTKAAI